MLGSFKGFLEGFYKGSTTRALGFRGLLQKEEGFWGYTVDDITPALP